MVIADLEAGIGTLTRMDDDSVDAVVIVAEATEKSLGVAKRALGLVAERAGVRTVVVANRVRGDEDLQRVRAALPGAEIVVVPDDPVIVQADRKGVAPLDLDADAPAVRALIGLANDLLSADARA